MKEVYSMFKHPLSSNYLFDIKAGVVWWQDKANDCYRVQAFDDLPYLVINTKYPKYKNMKLKWQMVGYSGFTDTCFVNDNIYVEARPLLQFNYDSYIEHMTIWFNGCKFRFYKDDIFVFEGTDDKDNSYYQIKVKKFSNEIGYKADNAFSDFIRLENSNKNIYPVEKFRFLKSGYGYRLVKRMNLMPFNTMYKVWYDNRVIDN